MFPFPDDAVLRGISIHALREEGDPDGNGTTEGSIISIHALREEGDAPQPRIQQSTIISIHALREEGDNVTRSDGESMAHFYPRPPRGGRHQCNGDMICNTVFLSTPSARRATRWNG